MNDKKDTLAKRFENMIIIQRFPTG